LSRCGLLMIVRGCHHFAFKGAQEVVHHAARGRISASVAEVGSLFSHLVQGRARALAAANPTQDWTREAGQAVGEFRPFSDRPNVNEPFWRDTNHRPAYSTRTERPESLAVRGLTRVSAFFADASEVRSLPGNLLTLTAIRRLDQGLVVMGAPAAEKKLGFPTERRLKIANAFSREPFSGRTLGLATRTGIDGTSGS
jgi:hypothetical protein